MESNKIKDFWIKHRTTTILLIAVIVIAWIVGQIAVPVVLKAFFL